MAESIWREWCENSYTRRETIEYILITLHNHLAFHRHATRAARTRAGRTPAGVRGGGGRRERAGREGVSQFTTYIDIFNVNSELRAAARATHAAAQPAGAAFRSRIRYY